MSIKAISNWAAQEFESADFNDERLKKRLIKLAEDLEKLPEKSIRQACGNWSHTKAAYRFFQNDKVDAQKILASHKAKTIERIESHQTVLAIQDTSFLTYTSHKTTSGLGSLTIRPGT